MTRPITKAEIEAAVRLTGDRRSDYDLNPEVKSKLNAGRMLRPAAVLCGLTEGEAGLSVILTERPTTMREHAGQIAFPGGKVDLTDAGALDAALREAEEEIGLMRTGIEIIGAIDPYETGTGYRIEPFVAFIEPGFTPRPDPYEVADAFEVPLDFLMNPTNLQLQTGVWAGAERRYYAIPWEGRHIWGATAGMLKSLSDRLAAIR